jgi:hypothetical protein
LWSVSRPGRLTPEKDPVPIVQEAGWAPGPVWTWGKNLAHTGIAVIYNCIKILAYRSRNLKVHTRDIENKTVKY